MTGYKPTVILASVKPGTGPKRKPTKSKRPKSGRVTVEHLAKKDPRPGGQAEDDPTVTIAASVPRSIAIATKRRAGAGNFSRFVTSALRHELSLSALDELVDGFVADGGQLDDAQVAAARKLINA